MFKNQKWVKFSPEESPAENVNLIEKRKHKSRSRKLSKSRNNREDEEMDTFPDELLVPYAKGNNLWPFSNDVAQI